MWLGLLSRVRLYRTCFFTGVFGSGKTLGAVALAWQLLAEDSRLRVISNIPVSFGVDLFSLDTLTDCVIILDEGRRYLDSRKWEKRDFNIDYLRHLNCYLIVSAAFDVDKRLRRLVAERIFPLYNLPLWFYRVKSDSDPSARLGILLGPRAFFGTYPMRFALTEREDLFFGLVDAFFERLVYVPPRLTREQEEWVASLVAKTVDRVRSAA